MISVKIKKKRGRERVARTLQLGLLGLLGTNIVSSALPQMAAVRRSWSWVGALALALPATSDVYPVPSVDMSLLDSGSPADTAAARASIVDACETSGLFRAAGSRMTEQLVADSLKAHRDVFSLPMESKMSVRFDNLTFGAAPGFTRGYVPLGGESGSAERLECKEVRS